MTRTAILAAGPALALALAACAEQAGPGATAGAGAATDWTLTEIASGLEFPWGMAFLPNGDLLVSEREGRLRIIRDGTLDPVAISGTPDDAFVERQGGYLDMALDPNFADNRLVYLSYSRGDADSNHTAVVRGRLSDDASALEAVEEIFASHVPAKRGGAHFGSRFGFLGDGTLLITLGDGFAWKDEAQSVDNHFGTIVRINRDGSLPADNPFADQAGPAAAVWTYGHRNVQGLVIDDTRGLIYAHEHGPKGGDELNLIEPGTNYGWPAITYGVNYDGSIITTETKKEGMAQPAVKWVPSIAPSGMTLYTGDAYPGWQGDLFIGAMNGPDGRKLVRIDLDEAGGVVGTEDLLKDRQLGFRDVETGPDGKLYLASMDIDGVVYRLDPAGDH